MKTIELEKESLDIFQIIRFARIEPVLLLTDDGQEFIVSQADDFEAEVEALRNSQRFQEFLDERMKCHIRYPIEDLEEEIKEELSNA